MDGWAPDLGQETGSLCERLVAALERDVRSGRLAPDVRLPTHRELALRLGLAVGTVTKAYAEGERRGLLTARVGRGSFVASRGALGAHSLHPAGTGGLIDLARNVPPVGPVAASLRHGIGRLGLRQDIETLAAYPAPEGPLPVRRAGADWLRRRHGLQRATPEALFFCNGGQQALFLVLSTLCRSGDTVLCEGATFHGAKALAAHAGLELVGVGMDHEGLRPDALEAAARATGARVLYTIPTLQNPTGRTMSLQRRNEIVAVARRIGLLIVEDDAYGGLADMERQPLADLAPDICFFVGGPSKALSTGLRTGFLLPPEGPWRERLLRAVRAISYAPAALPGLLFAQWVEDGVADRIADLVVGEARERLRIGLHAFAGVAERPSSMQALHLWLPMSELQAERVAGRALRAGVEVTPPGACIVEPGSSGVRVCLGGAADLGELRRGLALLGGVLADVPEAPAGAIV